MLKKRLITEILYRVLLNRCCYWLTLALWQVQGKSKWHLSKQPTDLKACCRFNKKISHVKDAKADAELSSHKSRNINKTALLLQLTTDDLRRCLYCACLVSRLTALNLAWAPIPLYSVVGEKGCSTHSGTCVHNIPYASTNLPAERVAPLPANCAPSLLLPLPFLLRPRTRPVSLASLLTSFNVFFCCCCGCCCCCYIPALGR